MPTKHPQQEYAHPLRHKGGFRVHLYWDRKQHRRYVGRDEKIANLIQSQVNHLVLAFKYGLLTIPENISLPDYIFSQAIQKPDPKEVNTSFTVTRLSHLINFYEAHSPSKAPNTLATEKIHLKHLRSFIQQQHYDPLLENITVGFFNDYQLSRKKQGVLSNTINKEIGTFQVMWKTVAYAHKSNGHIPKHLEHNILKDVQRDKRQPNNRFRSTSEVSEALKNRNLAKRELKKIKRFRYLTWDEIDGLIERARTRHGSEHWIIPVLICFAYTGLRRGELTSLTWDDVSFSNDTIVVSSCKMSRDQVAEDRYVDMIPELREVLLEQKKKTGDQPWVFPGPNGGQLNVYSLRSSFLRVIKNSPYEGIGFHLFRHSLATNLALAGVETWVISRILGHKTDKMHEHYKHLPEEARKEAMNKLRKKK